MQNQKPLTQQLEDRHTHSMALDPDTVARSFGVALPIGPLPESPFPATHAEDDDTTIQLDTRAPRPQPKPPLFDLVMNRLRSLKPRSPERKAEVEAVIQALAVPLQGLDLLVAELEAEHFNSIDKRWEEIRKEGRKLVDSRPKLQGAVYKWAQECNKSGEAKGQRKQDLETYFWQRKRVSQWSTSEEIDAADKKLTDAKEAMAAATQLALDDQRSMAVAESALATAQNHLERLRTELHRLEAELRGQPYFDPELGLPRDPLAHRGKW